MKPTYKEIWDTLSKVNVSNLLETKGPQNLSYLSWASAWGVLMEYYPEATYIMYDETAHPDGSVTVECSVTIGECGRTMWLPVMNYANKALINPTSKDISDSKMRCLVKCIAMFGLGHYVYTGEDLPSGSSPSTSAGAPLAIPSQTEGLPVSDRKIPCGKPKGKTYGEFFTELDMVNKAIDYYRSHAKSETQTEHLNNLLEHKRLNVETPSNGVLA
jgi:hypothetical protein